MRKYTIAVLVSNQFGVLNRVTSMFRRRQFNISALNVSETETNEYSRITVSFSGDEIKKQQLVNQLYKLPDVHSIKELNEDNAVCCELALIKVKNQPELDGEVKRAVEAFGAKTVDYSKNSIVYQLVDSTRRVDEFINIMSDFSILEICRSGDISLEKGETTIKKKIYYL